MKVIISSTSMEKPLLICQAKIHQIGSLQWNQRTKEALINKRNENNYFYIRQRKAIAGYYEKTLREKGVPMPACPISSHSLSLCYHD